MSAVPNLAFGGDGTKSAPRPTQTAFRAMAILGGKSLEYLLMGSARERYLTDVAKFLRQWCICRICWVGGQTRAITHFDVDDLARPTNWRQPPCLVPTRLEFPPCTKQNSTRHSMHASLPAGSYHAAKAKHTRTRNVYCSDRFGPSGHGSDVRRGNRT
jgi:hypothetical protein